MKETHLITKDALRVLLTNVRKDVSKGIVSAFEAKEILGISENEFYKEINSPESLARKSSKKGKFIYSSIIQEFKRIHGVSYSDAIVR